MADVSLRVSVLGVRRRNKKGVVWLSQFAFSQRTRDLILLFSTVLRTADVEITLSPPFDAIDILYA